MKRSGWDKNKRKRKDGIEKSSEKKYDVIVVACYSVLLRFIVEIEGYIADIHIDRKR